MDCRQARVQLEFATIGQDSAPNPDLLAAQRHLTECDSCRQSFLTQQYFDREIAHAMSSVPVPDSLTQRLMAAVNSEAVNVQPASPVPTQLPTPTAKRRFGHWILWGLLTAVPVIVLAAMLLAPGQVTLQDSDVLVLARLDLNSLSVDPQPAFPAPRGWNSQRDIQFGDSPRLAPAGKGQVPVLAFQVRTDRRATHSTGILFRLRPSQWRGTDVAPSFPHAPVQYTAFGTWVVWREGDTVFLCLLQGDAHAMERLQRMVDGSREFT